jgi:DinB superfamily
MTEDERDPAGYAADIDAARYRMIAFVAGCTEEQWHSVPLDGDPRPVGVVVDHVADAYDYHAGFIRQFVAGQTVVVNNDVVDALNARHAQAAAAVSKADATKHLRDNGAAISALVAGLSAADLDAGEGRVRRLAWIAAKHADDHRIDIESALASRGTGRS